MHHTSYAAAAPQNPGAIPLDQLITRLADDLIGLDAAEGATTARLVDLGWSPAFLGTYGETARARAEARSARALDVVPATRDIEADMAAIITGLLPPTILLIAELQGRGIIAADIDRHFQNARARAARAFCAGKSGETH